MIKHHKSSYETNETKDMQEMKETPRLHMIKHHQSSYETNETKDMQEMDQVILLFNTECAAAKKMMSVDQAKTE